MARNSQKLRIVTLKTVKKTGFLLMLIIVFELILFPAPTSAAENIIEEPKDIQGAVVKEEIKIIEVRNNLPENENLRVKWTGYYTITAYNSEVGQTDSTPCLTANLFNVCEHGIEDTIAVNFLKYGTKVRIPDIFGSQVFVVRDRMNKKYNDRLDIWMIDKKKAKKFGFKIAKIEVLEP